MMVHLGKCLERCEKAKIGKSVTSWWRKGHKISHKGIEVDRAKIEVIEKLPPPVNVKGVRSFLGHAGFYRRFLKDFSLIAKPLNALLQKEHEFHPRVP